jgi:hypothetical protein
MVFQDIELARSSVVLALPEHTILSEPWRTALQNRKKDVKLTIISNGKAWTELRPDYLLEESLSAPFIIIDQQLLWLGLPLEAAKGIHPPYIATRLDSEKVAEYVASQFVVGD